MAITGLLSRSAQLANPIRLQKKVAYHALLAREDFALNGPADARRLPLEHWECEQVRWSGRPLDYLTGQYAKCVVALFNVKAHPSFLEGGRHGQQQAK
jgi:hypothetical protein